MYPSVRAETTNSYHPALTPSPTQQAKSLATRGYNAAEAQILRDISSLETRKLISNETLRHR